MLRLKLSIRKAWLSRTSFACLLVPLLLTGCTTMAPGYEQPQVNVTSFKLAPESTSGPRFNIGLQVVNPNRTELRLAGMTYSIEIEGNRLMSGAQNELPVVAAYGTADILVQASPSLLGGVRLVADLLSGPGAALDYTFKARLDAGGMLQQIRVEESGSFDLPNR
jgi:LEA14-like dessication related protein